MGKQVQKAQSAELTNVEQDWGEETNMGVQDIVIPRILVMQPGSRAVTARKAAFGEIRDSVNNILLGTIDDAPLEFIPFYADRRWSEYKMVKNGKSEEKVFVKGYAVTPENENLPYSEVVDGEEIVRDYGIIVYVLLKKDLDEGMGFPYTINFKRTSVKAGRAILTQMNVKNKMAKLPPPAYMFKLNLDTDSNGTATYIVMSAELSEKTSQEHITKAYEWFKIIKNKSDNIIVDEGEDGEETPPPFNPGTTNY